MVTGNTLEILKYCVVRPYVDASFCDL